MIPLGSVIRKYHVTIFMIAAWQLYGYDLEQCNQRGLEWFTANFYDNTGRPYLLGLWLAETLICCDPAREL